MTLPPQATERTHDRVDPPADARAAAAPGVVPAADRAASAWRRTRVAVYVAFVAIAVNAGLQAWQTGRIADARTLDAEIIAEAGRHDALVQRLGRLAARSAVHPDPESPPVSALAAELVESRFDALRVRQMAQVADQVVTASSPALRSAFDDWDGARERIWYRAESLLAHADAGRGALVPEASEAVEREIAQAARSARALVVALQQHSRELGALAVRRSGIGAAITWSLLALLALGVVAPALRALQSQAAALARQAAENQRLALVAEHTGHLVVMTDAERRIVWANQAFTRTTGYELHEAMGHSPAALLQSERTDRAAVARMRRALDAGKSVRLELLNRSRDGRDYWIDADIQPLRDGAGELSGFIAVESVITEQVTQRLRGAALLAALPHAVVVHDREGCVTEANPAAQELLRVRIADRAEALLEHGPLDDELEPLQLDDLPVRRTLRSGRAERGQVLGLNDRDGTRRWLLAHTQPLHDALGHPDGVVACYVDMTERRLLLEQMRESARRDPLTSLPNRTVVLERVQRAIEHRRRHPAYGFAVLFMDIDRFKHVNDTLGHGAGDDLLRQVADRLEIALRPGDAVGRVDSGLRTAARIGGDEFVIVLEGIRHADDARQIAQRLLVDLSRPYRLGSSVVHVSVSIGIVSAQQAAPDADAVLRDCDTAMYEAKRAGRGRWVMFDASMHERVRAALELEGDLRRALAADELTVAYQPVVTLPGHDLVGVEALARWRHPVRGDVSPGEFIPLAEEVGLIDELGDVVLRKACAHFGGWQRRWGKHAPGLLAVNLSRAQLKQPGLVPEVMAVLEANGMRAEQLQLEVTESFAAQDEQVQAMLRAFKAAGVRLALDDFGTGYSSLACLDRLPVDTVKVDRSFVAHAGEVEYHRVLISATIRVARALGITTVAEGIETKDQADLMAALDCDRGQGWFFGRAVPAAELERQIECQASDSLV